MEIGTAAVVQYETGPHRNGPRAHSAAILHCVTCQRIDHLLRFLYPIRLDEVRNLVANMFGRGFKLFTRVLSASSSTKQLT
eukprot:997729-Amphidinium_carterae.1